MTKLAVNPETGETLALIGGQWQPAKIAQNDKGDRMFLGESGWEAFPAPERSMGTRALRAAEFAARGFLDSAAETVGAVPDLLNRGLRYVGVPVPGEDGGVTKGIKSAISTAGQFLSSPLNAALMGRDMGPNTPETTGEKFAYGGGRGTADALSVMLPAAGVARMARPGTMTQGVATSLAAQPGMQIAAGAAGGAVGEATDSPALGLAAALATPAIASAGRRLISPVTSSLTPEEARRAAMAQSMGIELTPGQQTGSRPLQGIESSLTQLPFSGSRQAAVYDAQRQGFNRAALDRVGVNADRASPDVLDRGFRQLGQQFDNLAASTQLRVDPQFEQDIMRAATEYGRRLDTSVAPVFQSYVDDLGQAVNAARQPGVTNVTIDGRTYQNIHSDLARAAREARNNPALQRALTELQNALDGLMVRSAPPDVANAWGQVRGQYRNLLAIDNAMAGGTQADRAAGNIPLGSFRQSVKAQDPKGAARGRHDMGDLAEVADFLAMKIPNSGTAERSQAMRMLQGGGMFGGTGGTAAIAGADPVMAALTGALSVGTPAAIQAFINSPAGRAWLTNQAMTGRGPQMNRGLAAALLGGQAKDELLAQP